MEQPKDFDEILDMVNGAKEDVKVLSQCLVEISYLIWQMSDEIANATTLENSESISAKESAFKMSFSEAEARGIVNTSGHKTLLKNRLESLKYLFAAVEWKLQILTSVSSQPRLKSALPHQA